MHSEGPATRLLQCPRHVCFGLFCNVYVNLFEDRSGKTKCVMGLLNLYSHEVFRKDDFALEDLFALADDVGGITYRVEMGEEKSFTV